MEGFTGRSSILYHVTPPTQTHQIEPVRRIAIEAADDGLHRHRLTKTGAVPARGDAITGRIPLYFNSDVIFGIVRPAEPMPAGTFYRNGIADEMLYVHEGSGVCDTIFGPLRYGPGDYLVLPIGTTWRLDPDAGSEQRLLYLEAPSEIVAAAALPQRLRPAPRTRPVLTARHPCPGRGRPARRARRLRDPRPEHRPDHRLPLPPPPVRPGRLGRLPLAVPLQHRRLPADHRARPSAAAGPPDVPGAQLRGLLIRAPQVRLPPAGDPGAVQPLEHQQRRGHLLRRAATS